MKYDEIELIEFFGVLPTEQNSEEKEFFGTTIFDLAQYNHHLSISFSTYYNDFQLDLRANDLQVPLLELRLEGVEEIAVRRDKANVTPALLIKTTAKDEGGTSQTVEVVLQPNMGLKITNRNQ